VSALTQDRLQLKRVKKTPRQMTLARRKTEQLLGRKIPVPAAERKAYIDAGQKPPIS